MDKKKLREIWNKNARSWTELSRAGYDVYRDYINTPAFLATLDASTTVSENTNALVPYSTEVFDTHNAYNNTAGNYKFTIPTGYDGKYVFHVNLECDDNVQTWDRYILRISFDGGASVTTILGDIDQSHTFNVTQSGSVIQNLSAGAEVQIYAQLNVVATSADPEVVRGHFGGYRLIGV